MSVLTNQNLTLTRPEKDDQVSLAKISAGCHSIGLYILILVPSLQLISASGIIQDHSNNRNPEQCQFLNVLNSKYQNLGIHCIHL